MSDPTPTELVVNVSSEIFLQLHTILTKLGCIPWYNEKLAREGYQTMVIGVAPPSFFGYHITFVLEEGDVDG